MCNSNSLWGDNWLWWIILIIILIWVCGGQNGCCNDGNRLLRHRLLRLLTEKSGAVRKRAAPFPCLRKTGRKRRFCRSRKKIGKNSDFLLPKRQKCGILNKHCSEATLNRNLDL